LWPGASEPLDGLKAMRPGTLVNANQFRGLCASGLESTLAKQTKVCPLLQSRCPTKLIEDGRKSRMGCAATTGGEVGCVGCTVGLDFGAGVGVGVCVAVGVGASVGTAVGVDVTWLAACPVV